MLSSSSYLTLSHLAFDSYVFVSLTHFIIIALTKDVCIDGHGFRHFAHTKCLGGDKYRYMQKGKFEMHTKNASYYLYLQLELQQFIKRTRELLVGDWLLL